MEKEIELNARVERMLQEGNFNFQKEVILGDARPDFLITTTDGFHILIETKAWEPSPANRKRALNQVKIYQELSKAHAAIIVTPEGKTINVESGGIVPVSGLKSKLDLLVSSFEKGDKQSKSYYKPRKAPKKKVFASIPFADQYDDTFLVAIDPASLSNGAIAERVDHHGVAGDVVVQIKSMIRNAIVVVADLSESRPNVLHEVGFAEALGKPVIQICSTKISDLPFNVRNNQTIKYSFGQTTKLKKQLEEEIAKLIKV